MKNNYCLLIVPPFVSGKGSILSSFTYTMPPVGLLSIAAYLRENGIEVRLLDFTINAKQSFDKILQFHFKKYGIPNWIGLSVCTPVAYNSYEITDYVKNNFSEIKIVLGGPHITVLEKRIFDECKSVDFLITGEGEYSLLQLIKYSNFNIDNILTPDGNKENTIKTKAVELDITKLPMPAYDLLEFKKYVPPPASLQSKTPGIGIITSRGCPYKCTFCARITGNKLRHKTIEQVVDEIKYLKQKFKIKQFHFHDDTITSKKSYITKLCETFINENLNLHWACLARVDTVDLDLLKLMRKAGCFVIMYGVESLDEKVLKDLKKGINLTQINSALKATKEAKIESRISLIIGSPTETLESLNKTKKYFLKLDTDFFQAFIAVPMPGSQFYIQAKQENRIINENWSEYNLSKVLYKHPVFTEKQLFKVQREMYLSFYLRWKIVFRMLRKVNSFTALKNIWKGFKGFVLIVKS